MKSRKWPSKRSELQRDNSIIFTTNSRAGCDITWEPRPRPYHRPVHHARLVSSCLNSRDKNTAIRTLWTARWMAITVMRPRTAWDAFHNSRNHWKIFSLHYPARISRHVRGTQRTRAFLQRRERAQWKPRETQTWGRWAPSRVQGTAI